MSYTFDEANKTVDVFDKDFELEYWMPNSKVYEIIDKLRQEYAPTIEMTQDRKDNFIYMKKEGCSFIETICDIDSGVLIREFDSYWKPLSEEQLMQAWLQPETIKVIGEQNNEF